MSEEWVPKTRLGRMVASGEIKSIDEVFASALPLKEPQIIDKLVPNLVDEVLDITMVQRMTDSGRRVKFRATVAIGNEDGLVGVGVGKDAQVGNAIRKALDDAKLNLVRVRRGCGSWECGCGGEHTVPVAVSGKCGSVRIQLIPAPRGVGLVAGDTAKKVLKLAGIKDVWTRVWGETRTAINFARATYDALRNTNMVKM